jgi:flagellin
MALTIGTNVASLQASAAASSVNRDLETSMARLSTGKRINSASDDAAGVAIASRLTAEIRGTDQAIRNALDGQALIDTAEGGHKEIEAILQRMREISVQAANDTNNTQDRGNLQAEMDALVKEIDRISGVTTWAGNSVMNGSGTSGSTKTFSLQVGAATGTKNQIDVAIGAMDTATLGVGSATISLQDTPLGSVGEGNTSDVIIPKLSNYDTLTYIDSLGSSFIDLTFSDTSDGADTIIEIKGVTYTALFSDTAGSAVSKANIIGGLLSDFRNATYPANDPTGNFGGWDADGTISVEVINGGTIMLSDYEVNDDSANALYAVKAIDAAIKTVNTQRSELGAISNRLSHTVSNMTNISTNLSAARGGIEDADFAVETTQLAKNQILQQASTAMMAQANASKQGVLSLLQ